jgi:quercetin dioxygenase-like cupin family protein
MRTVMTLLAAALLAAGAAHADDRASREATLVDRESHTVVFENEHVRVIENISAPGKTSPMHTHGSMVLVSIGLARLKLTLPDGEDMIFDLRPGQVLWMDNPEHSWEMLAGQLHVVAIEVKSAASGD